MTRKIRHSWNLTPGAAIALQREFAVAEEESARKVLEVEGCEFVELTADQRAAFVRAVKPVHDEARSRFGEAVFALLKADGS